MIVFTFCHNHLHTLYSLYCTYSRLAYAYLYIHIIHFALLCVLFLTGEGQRVESTTDMEWVEAQ